ncbi:MAG: amino acid adenylation domain-containing protein, partial [bacterium]|nr:amino acid adenylation domain-containing protein [bacterium]
MKPLDKKNIADILPLTPVQEGMLFHYLKAPGNNTYFEQLCLEISGNLENKLFQQAWNTVIRANEALRTVFRWEKMDKPVQVVLKEHQPEPSFLDFSSQPDMRPTLIAKLKQEDKSTPFDLLEVPFRITLCRLENNRHLVIISNHHILYDGWSNGIILKEFFEAYNMAAEGKDPVITAKTKFKEYIKWLQGLDAKKQETFWKEYLAGYETQIEFSIKKKKKDIKTGINERHTYNLTAALVNRLEAYAAQQKVTQASILNAAWGLLLQKYNNCNDVVFGTTVAGRNADIKGMEEIAGLFINTVPLRVKVLSQKDNQKTDTIATVIQDIHRHLRQRREFENTPPVNIKEYSSLDVKEELFDTLLVLENYPLDERLKQKEGAIIIDSFSMAEATHYDLTAGITLFDGIRLEFNYNSARFETESIRQLTAHFTNILQDMVDNPGKEAVAVTLMHKAEQDEILHRFNRPAPASPGDKTLEQLLEEQAAKNPESTALIAENETAEGTGEIKLTYAQLNGASTRLARRLTEKGFQPGNIAGLMVERSPRLVTAIFAILKAGGAYLPIDPTFPAERVRYMLEDSNAKILLSNSGVRLSKADFTGKKTACIEIPIDINTDTQQTPPAHNVNDVPQVQDPASGIQHPESSIQHPITNLAYIIYTSGTTGKPKGVAVTHASVVNRMYWLKQKYGFNETDVVMQKTTLTFDVSVCELFRGLLPGAALYLLPQGREKEPEAIIDATAKHSVTIIGFVPSMLEVFLEEVENSNALQKLNTLRWIIVGAEVLPKQLTKRFNEVADSLNARLINAYGPTEATVDVTHFDCAEAANYDTVPIGKPIANSRILVLDRNNRLQPVGVPGELCITGPCLAAGYLNRPELTAEKFQSSPNNQYPITNNVFYFTGDLVRWLPDGNIDFLGRIDHQVKVRGYRIELGEIENNLLKINAIRNAVVIDKKKDNDTYLCAYITAETAALPEEPGIPGETREETFIADVRRQLAAILPDYMIPAYFIKMEKFPLASSGKIDRKALPEPELNTTRKYTAPRNEVEQKIAAIWTGVLNTPKEQTGIDQDFFRAGGHSLKATLLLSRIHKKLDVKIPLAQLFETPTIRGLAHYITTAAEETENEITKAPPKNYYPLSPAQGRVYLLHQMDPGNIHYNMHLSITCKEKPDARKVEQVSRQLIARHESLRTSFHVIDKKPVQKIHAPTHIHLEVSVIGKEDTIDNDNKNLYSIVTPLIKPFDLSQPPLLRVAIVEAERPLIFMDMHHIVSDGTSAEILEKEFHALCEGEELPPLRLQYRDYVMWQKNAAYLEKIKKQENYWLKQFDGEIPQLELPLDFRRPVTQRFEGANVGFYISKEVTESLRAIAAENKVTLYMLLLALLNILLARISGNEDIILGTPVDGRGHTDLEKITGMFVNTLALRNRPEGENTTSTFLAQLKEHTIQAFDNRDYPFEKLIDELKVVRNTGRNPLFDVMFSQENMEYVPGYRDVPDGTLIYREDTTAKFDMTLGCIDTGERLLFDFEYSSKLFKKETIKGFTAYFKRILAHVVVDPGVRISSIEVLSQEEKNLIMREFNNTETQYPRGKTLHQLLDERAQSKPDSRSVVGFSLATQAPGETGQPGEALLTNMELNKRAAATASILESKGVAPGDIVGLMMERSIEMITGIMAILKTGAAYLPIDPAFPAERIQYMLEDSKTKILLSDNGIRLSKLALTGKPNACIEIPVTINTAPPPVHPVHNVHHVHNIHEPASGIAYIIYTSGTTGKPKGVAVPHSAAVNRMYWIREAYQLDKNDVVMQKTAITFDVSVCELFRWLLPGATLYLLPRGGEREPEVIINAIEKHHITTADFVPSMLTVFMEEVKERGIVYKLRTLRWVVVGAETAPPELVETFIQKISSPFDTRLVNAYGPTEATVDVTRFDCEAAANYKKVPIGKPIANTTLLILDKYHRLQPVGIPGELCITGACLAAGYLNRPELTAEKFKKDSWQLAVGSWQKEKQKAKEPEKVNPSQLPGTAPQIRVFGGVGTFLQKGSDPPVASLYHTGDRARWLPDGNIDFLGRIDHQVKIRGYRIEPDEIKNQLLTHEDVKEAVVVVRKGRRDDKYLCAFFVTKAELASRGTVIGEILRIYLEKRLPQYMVPSYFKALDKIPLTANGKVDNKKLAEIKIETGDDRNTYAPPRNEIEKKLAALWAGILEEEKHPGIDDNFFRSGGHSLIATILVALIQKELEVKIPLSEVFKRPTIRGMAEYIAEGAKEAAYKIERSPEKEYYPLSSAQMRMYLLYRMAPESVNYNMPFAIPVENTLDKKRVAEVVGQLIARHESLRTTFFSKDRIPVQKIHTAREVHINVEDFGTAGEEQMQTLLKNSLRPFDLSQLPLFRIGIAGTPTGQNLLLWDMHHIITDGMSVEILQREFRALYSGKKLAPPGLRYRDFAQWQRAAFEGALLEQQERYWLDRFGDELPVLELPLDYQRPVIQSFEGAQLYFYLGEDETFALNKLAVTENVTVFMLTAALYNILLTRLSGAEDIIVGTPTAGRRHADLMQIVGMFVNTLPLRNYPAGDKTFLSFLAELKTDTLAAFENQDYQFETLVEKLEVPRNTGRNPVFDAFFSMQNSDNREIKRKSKGENKGKDKEGSTAGGELVFLEDRISKFDITLNIEEGKRLKVSFEYCTKLFKRETVQRFGNYFKRIVSAVLSDQSTETIGLADIEILSQEEKHRLLYDYNDTAAQYPDDKTIHQLFEEQMLKNPNGICTVGKGEPVGSRQLPPLSTPSTLSTSSTSSTSSTNEAPLQESYRLPPTTTHLTFRELDESSSKLAAVITARGIKPGDIIAITEERSVEMLIGIMAILKAGGAYLPIAPTFPEDRITYMLKDSKAALILAPATPIKIPHPIETINITETLKGNPPISFPNNQSPITNNQNLAYIIYTSGSTGRPKGVLVEHRNVARLVKQTNYIEYRSDDRLLMTGAFVFDVTTFEMWGPLLNGIGLCIATKEDILDAVKLENILVRNRITILHLIPQLFNQMAEQNTTIFANLRYFLVGGDLVGPRWVSRVRERHKHLKIRHMYGPTENTTFSTYFPVQTNYEGRIPIGKPLANSTVYLLNKYGGLVPEGVPGEICVGGAGVARGY